MRINQAQFSERMGKVAGQYAAGLLTYAEFLNECHHVAILSTIDDYSIIGEA